jgi:hypothetical protein
MLNKFPPPSGAGRFLVQEMKGNGIEGKKPPGDGIPGNTRLFLIEAIIF